MSLLKNGLTFDDDFLTFNVYYLTGLLVNEILVPALHHATSQFLADELLEVRLCGFHLLRDVENVKNILIRLIADSAQQRSHRQFLFSVDVGVHHIVDVGRKFHP